MIHLALMGGILTLVAVASLVPFDRVEGAEPLRVVLPLIALASFLGAALLRRRLPTRQPEESPNSWWTRSTPLAVAVWGMLELPSVLAAVVFMLTGDRAALLWCGIGLLLFLLMTPGRLSDGAR